MNRINYQLYIFTFKMAPAVVTYKTFKFVSAWKCYIFDITWKLWKLFKLWILVSEERKKTKQRILKSFQQVWFFVMQCIISEPINCVEITPHFVCNYFFVVVFVVITVCIALYMCLHIVVSVLCVACIQCNSLHKTCNIFICLRRGVLVTMYCIFLIL